VVLEHFPWKEVWEFFFIFADFFFEKKKRVATFRMISVGFGAKFAKYGCISEFLSKKNPS
jgi:hypothetical protein